MYEYARDEIHLQGVPNFSSYSPKKILRIRLKRIIISEVAELNVKKNKEKTICSIGIMNSHFRLRREFIAGEASNG